MLELPVSALSVQTPLGFLVAVDKNDSDSPGIELSLMNADSSESKRVAVTEYSGQAIACTSDKKHPHQTAAELEDVPANQIIYDRGIRYVKPCLVTRAWPDETTNREFHTRTFHISRKDVKYAE